MDMDAGMDLLQGIQEGLKDAPVSKTPPDLGDFEMPSLEKILETLEHMDMDDEEKAKIRESIMGQGNILENFGKSIPSVNTADVGSAQFIVFFVAVMLVTLVFVFFGYKLYKSLTEKERRREEKKKQKQQKKKK